MVIHHLRPSLNTVITVSFPSQVINVFRSHSLPLHSLTHTRTHTQTHTHTPHFPLSPSLRSSPSLLVAFLLFSPPLSAFALATNQRLFLSPSSSSCPFRRAILRNAPGPTLCPNVATTSPPHHQKERHPKTLLVGGHASLGSMLHALCRW